MDGSVVGVVVVLFLFGLGYAAWRWLIRRLRACEDRVAQLEGQRAAQRERLARWPPAEGEDR